MRLCQIFSFERRFFSFVARGPVPRKRYGPFPDPFASRRSRTTGTRPSSSVGQDRLILTPRSRAGARGPVPRKRYGPFPEPVRDQAIANYRGRVCVPNYRDSALFSVGQDRLILTPRTRAVARGPVPRKRCHGLFPEPVREQAIANYRGRPSFL